MRSNSVVITPEQTTICWPVLDYQKLQLLSVNLIKLTKGSFQEFQKKKMYASNISNIHFQMNGMM